MYRTRLATVEILLTVAHMVAAVILYSHLLHRSRRLWLYLAHLLDR